MCPFLASCMLAVSLLQRPYGWHGSQPAYPWCPSTFLTALHCPQMLPRDVPLRPLARPPPHRPGVVCRVWSLGNGRCLAVLLGHAGHVTCLALAPDGDTLVSGAHDATLR